MDYPILMADIVRSSERNSSVLMNQFKTLIKSINDHWKKELISPPTITLGDEFQGVIKSVDSAIRIIFAIEEIIISKQYQFKLRYVLNYGEIDTPINKKIAYEMLGEGLTLARSELNKLKNSNRRFYVMLQNNNSHVEKMINESFVLYQYFTDSWKTKDQKMVSDFLLHEDYKTVAENLDVNKSTAWRREKSLNIEEYKISKELILKICYLYDRL